MSELVPEIDRLSEILSELIEVLQPIEPKPEPTPKQFEARIKALGREREALIERNQVLADRYNWLHDSVGRCPSILTRCENCGKGSWQGYCCGACGYDGRGVEEWRKPVDNVTELPRGPQAGNGPDPGAYGPGSAYATYGPGGTHNL